MTFTASVYIINRNTLCPVFCFDLSLTDGSIYWNRKRLHPKTKHSASEEVNVHANGGQDNVILPDVSNVLLNVKKKKKFFKRFLKCDHYCDYDVI